MGCNSTITAWSRNSNAPYIYRLLFFIDSLSAMRCSSSYSEVQRFEVTVACSGASGVLRSNIKILETSLLFVEDKVDQNIIPLDGIDILHGMRMIAAITLVKQASLIISKQKIDDLKLI